VIPRRKLPLYGLVLAYGISQLGTLMSGLAIPWLVLVTTGSAARTGLVGFAEMAPYVVAQAISGPVVDRFGLRRSCVTGNVAAAVLVGAIPALYAAGERLTVRGYLSRLGDGMRFLRADRLIAGIALMVAVANLLDTALDSVFVPVWVHTRLHQPSGLGLIGGAMALGSVAGALAGTWLGPRMPRYLTYAFGFLLGGCPVFIALAFASALPPVMVVAALGGLAGGALNPIIGAVAYERVPARLQASVLGAFRASAWIGIPFGSLLGGALAEGIGLRDALLVTGTAMFLTTLAPFVFPSWRGMNRRPQPQPLPSGEPDAVAH